jgi:hypothetical protein
MSSEEKEAFGSKNWIIRKISHLDKNNSYFLNIDSVGRGKCLFILEGTGIILKRKSDKLLYNLLRKSSMILYYQLEKISLAMNHADQGSN